MAARAAASSFGTGDDASPVADPLEEMRAALDSLARTADEHGLDLPELHGYRRLTVVPA